MLISSFDPVTADNPRAVNVLRTAPSSVISSPSPGSTIRVVQAGVGRTSEVVTLSSYGVAVIGLNRLSVSVFRNATKAA